MKEAISRLKQNEPIRQIAKTLVEAKSETWYILKKNGVVVNI